MTENRVGGRLVAVGTLTNGEVAPTTLLAFTANDRKRHHHPIAYLEFLVFRTDLDHFAHELVARDVARLHPRHEAVIEVQI
jgi:hypothetical protein